MEGYLAEIRMFGGNFAPRGWMFCHGQLLSIAQWTAVFALVGTTYGGNGQTTFGLPDLRGRIPVGTGQGPGLPNIDLGEMAGTPTTTLISTNLPAHTHTLSASGSMACATGAGNADSPGGNIMAGSATDENYSAPVGANGSLAPVNVSGNTSIAGNNLPLSITQPYLGLYHIMCVEGIFPSRN